MLREAGTGQSLCGLPLAHREMGTERAALSTGPICHPAGRAAGDKIHRHKWLCASYPHGMRASGFPEY